MLKTVICDDEVPALSLMSDLLAETGEIEIAAACQSVHDALDVINRGGIDLVIFDIEMPEIGGVMAYESITATPRPLVIFATAHPEYAVEAFGIDAIDYIMKPLEFGRVAKAVKKAARLRRLVLDRERGAPIAASESPPADASGVLKIKDAGRFYFIPYKDIIWIEAAGDYSILHAADREITARLAIKILELELPAGLFVRVHRSAIVAKTQISEIKYLPKGEAQILLSNGASVRTSRSYKEAVQSLGIIE